MRVRVATERCSGHARCAIHAPDVFQLDALGYNVTPLLEVPPEQQQAARKGAAACPEGAIAIEDDEAVVS